MTILHKFTITRPSIHHFFISEINLDDPNSFIIEKTTGYENRFSFLPGALTNEIEMRAIEIENTLSHAYYNVDGDTVTYIEDWESLISS